MYATNRHLPSFPTRRSSDLCENTPIPGREEYLHSEKYEYKVWDWDRPGHIKRDIAVLNRFRRENPALHELTNLRFLDCPDRKSTRLNSSHANISYAVFCLKK